jgi:hypothetical protein
VVDRTDAPTTQRALEPHPLTHIISALANLDGNSLGADRCPNLKPPAFAILGRNQGGCHDRYERLHRAADFAAAVKLLAIDANWFSGTYCRN